MNDAPDDVRRLAIERDRARAERDYARADELRDRIAALGYRVVDGPSGWSLEAIEAAVPARVRPLEVESVLSEPPSADVSVHWVVDGWPEDVVRALHGFRANEGGRDVQYVVSDLTTTDPATYGDAVEVLALETGVGWGAARNAGLRRSRGRIVLVLDGSIEPVGDVFGPVEAALTDGGIGVCGPFGIATTDLREFAQSQGPDVDAIEGYLMAFRREVLADAGLFDERFRWYRTADIELSFRIKDGGLRAVVVPAPVTRHVHRTWESTPADDRDRLSRRNYNRFLDRFRDRFDLLVTPPRDGAGGGPEAR
ncbi:MAG: glycosyltransferase [Actinomycetota bacterium]